MHSRTTPRGPVLATNHKSESMKSDEVVRTPETTQPPAASIASETAELKDGD